MGKYNITQDTNRRCVMYGTQKIFVQCIGHKHNILRVWGTMSVIHETHKYAMYFFINFILLESGQRCETVSSKVTVSVRYPLSVFK